jgi:hypothetical protein
MSRDSPLTLSDLARDRLGVTCTRCGRSGIYSVRRLLAERGDIRLTDFLEALTADCPRRRAVRLHEGCWARLEFRQG